MRFEVRNFQKCDECLQKIKILFFLQFINFGQWFIDKYLCDLFLTLICNGISSINPIINNKIHVTGYCFSKKIKLLQ